MKIPTLEKLLEDQLKDIFSAETQLSKALPKMAKAAKAEGLKECFQSHLEETRGQLERLNQIGQKLGIKLTGKKCAAMEGLLEEGKEAMETDGPDAIFDLGLIAAAQRVEHYEISAYGSAIAAAEHLGHDEIVGWLQESLDQESAADEKLTAIAQDEIFPNAAGEEVEEEEEGALNEDGDEAATEKVEEPVAKKGKPGRKQPAMS